MNIYTDDTHEAKYLVIECANGGDSFEDRMIAGLDIPTLLKPVSFTDESERYDISGYVTIEDAMKNRCLKREEIMELLLSIDTSIRYLEERMLGDANILLDPMFIYTDGKAGNVFFPVTRSGSDLFPKRMRKLSELLFIHADAEDAETLKFASGLMKISLGDSFRMHDIMRFIEKSRKEKVNTQTVKSKPLTEPEPKEQITAIPSFDEALQQELFEKEISEKTNKGVLSDGKKIRAILLIGALIVSVLDIVCMALGNNRAAKLLPILLLVSALAAGYNIVAAVLEKKKH